MGESNDDFFGLQAAQNHTAPAPAAPAPAPAVPPISSDLGQRSISNMPDLNSIAALPNAPGSHKNLWAMLSGLGVALSATGKAISTHGKEGGAPDVNAYYQQQQNMRLQQQRAELEKTETKSRIELQGAQTIAHQAATQAALAKLPVEIFQMHVNLQNELEQMYEKGGYDPQTSLAMAQQQAPIETLKQIQGAMTGDLGTHVLTAHYDSSEKHGIGQGTIGVGSTDALAQLQIPKSGLSRVLGAMSNYLEVAQTAGVDPKKIEAAKAKLQHFQSMPEGATVNGADWHAFSNMWEADIVQGIKAKQENTQIKEKQAQEERAQREADPVLKLSTPDELAKPGAIPAIQAMIADPKTKPEDLVRYKSLLPRAQVAQQRVLGMKEAELRAQQTIAQGDPNVAGQLLANHLMTIDELKLRNATPQFITGSVNAALKINPQYNARVDQAWSDQAKAEVNVNFFNNVDTLITKGGTLKQLDNTVDTLPTGQIPKFNSIANVVSANLGSGPVAGYAASVLAVTNDIARVTGGGQATVTAQQMFLKSLNMAQSPEQLHTAIEHYRNAIMTQRNTRGADNPFMEVMHSMPITDRPRSATKLAPGTGANAGKTYYTDDNGMVLGRAK